MVGVKDEGDVERLGGELGGLLARHHVEEIAREGELGIGSDHGLPAPDPLPGRHQRRHLRRQADALPQRRLARVVRGVGIEGGQRRDARAEDLHGRGLLGQLPEHGDQLGGQLPIRRRGKRLDVGVQLLPARQLAVPEEVRHLLEGRLRDEVVYIEAPIEEAALVAVDEADVRCRDDNVLETSLQGIRGGVTHGVPDLLGAQGGNVPCSTTGPYPVQGGTGSM